MTPHGARRAVVFALSRGRGAPAPRRAGWRDKENEADLVGGVAQRRQDAQVLRAMLRR